MPRWPEKELNTQELPGVEDKGVTLPSTGPIAESLYELNKVEVHSQPLSNDYADALAMAEEMLTVMIHEDTDPNAEDPVQLGVNGINQFVFRGKPQDIRRKYVAVLARCKRTRISTPEVADGAGGRTNRVNQSSSLRYPFSVMYDPNPKGAVWLRNIMTEA